MNYIPISSTSSFDQDFYQGIDWPEYKSEITRIVEEVYEALRNTDDAERLRQYSQEGPSEEHEALHMEMDYLIVRSVNRFLRYHGVRPPQNSGVVALLVVGLILEDFDLGDEDYERRLEDGGALFEGEPFPLGDAPLELE